MSARTHHASSALLALLAISAAVATLGCSCARKHGAGTSMKPIESSDPAMRCPAALLSARRGGTEPGRYVVPSEADRVAMGNAAEKLVREGVAARDDVATLVMTAGFELVDVGELPGVVLLRERESSKRGGGAYLFRIASKSRLFVEAPHTFFDEGTLPLACELFQRSLAHALFIETAHRYKSAIATEDGGFPADVAHSSDSLYQAVTEGVMRATPNARVVQLHGFAARDADASIVLSSGEKSKSTLVDRAQARLVDVLGKGVLRFPEESVELGATTNVQGDAVRRAGGEFLHVEIVAPLRRDLLSNPQLRASFLAALAAALEGA